MTTIEYAEWPRDAPSALERKVITIVCGNSRLHWALHEGITNKFIPIMFWHTAHDDDDEDGEDGSGDDDDDDEEDEDTCRILEQHIAGQAHSLIFGGTENHGTVQNVSETAAKRDSPGISVYVISSNPPLEKKIRYMFRDVPAKIFKLKNTDFFTPEQGVYPTMGVDRVAALYGAKLHYTLPALVIDGGTAMTYTVLDENSNIVGGGIGPGVKLKLQSLSDYTGSLPSIDHKRFKSIVEEAINSKTPIPFFAKDTEVAMISSVCGELACHLRNIVKQFVSQFQPNASTAANVSEVAKKEKKLTVIITGGDGKFLQDLLERDASGIVTVEPGVTSVVPNNNVDVKHVKNILHYALGDLIYKKCSEKPMNPEERLQLKIQGLRIASPAIDVKDLFSRGCIYAIQTESMIDGYQFHARFDNGIRKVLTLRQLYDGLALYNEIGEKAKTNTTVALYEDVDEEWVSEKKIWSKKVQEELGNRSRSVRNRMRELKPYVEKGELHKLFRTRTVKRAAKRAKRLAEENPQTYLGMRYAKHFPIEDPSVAVDLADTIFFGTVKYISDPDRIWFFVQFDDGDSEEVDLEELCIGLDLYNQHKHNDSMQRTTHDLIAPAVGRKEGKELPVDEEDATVFASLSSIVDLMESTNNGGEDSRMISEFKEDI